MRVPELDFDQWISAAVWRWTHEEIDMEGVRACTAASIALMFHHLKKIWHEVALRNWANSRIASLLLIME
jgi:hypothetical protein